MLPLKPRQLLEVATQGLRPLDFAGVADRGQVRDAEIGAADGQILSWRDDVVNFNGSTGGEPAPGLP
jgi:hypothetical protein